MRVTTNDQFIRFLAAWALVHETADEGWKAAVERGESQEPGAAAQGPDAFVDGLSSLVAAEKERLKAQITAGDSGGDLAERDIATQLEELRFEVAQLRGCFESLQASVDALLKRSQG